jgi:hypothetical protein
MPKPHESSSQAMVTLPGLKDIFEALRQGRHLCQADGSLYRYLEDHRETFTDLFGQLGFELKKHRRDFYYFYSRNTISEKSERMAVFMFMLIEWITDQGHNIEETLMNQQFNCDELPHLSTGRYRDILSQLSIFDRDGLVTIITNMARMGFVERVNEKTFAFRSPVYRFLDICQEIASHHEPDVSDVEVTEQ